MMTLADILKLFTSIFLVTDVQKALSVQFDHAETISGVWSTSNSARKPNYCLRAVKKANSTLTCGIHCCLQANRSLKGSDKITDTTSIRSAKVYVTVWCLSVLYRPLQHRVAGLLLWARRAGDIARLLHDQRPVATAPQQHSAQQRCVFIRRRKLNTDFLTEKI